MTKITLIGDIMCEPLLLKAARRPGGTFDFSGVFEYVKPLLQESDYVIGNLETPIAGEKAGYVRELFLFNAPDAFAETVKESGVDFVSTANNHCMDRGIKGLVNTIQTLDRIGISHSGTYEDCGIEQEPFVADINGTRVAILPFTYGTNYGLHRVALPNNGYVDLLHPDTEPCFVAGKKGVLSKVKGFVRKSLKREQIAAIKKALGKAPNTARKDDYLNETNAKAYFDRLNRKIERAHEQADLVVFFPHVGGQFNMEPGLFTEYTIGKALEYGVDAIVASHPHVVQKARIQNGVPIFYSIGNFSMSPNSVYLLHENLPDYGLAVHLYVADKKIVKTTFSILKIIEKRNEMLTVWPIDKINDSVETDVKKIYLAVTGKALTGDVIRHEYVL